MNYKNTKQKGNVGIGAAIAYFTLQGWPVAIPLTDSQEYDLIVEIDNELNKIQVKTSDYRVSSGAYEVSLKTSGGNRSRNYKTAFDGSKVDYLYIYTGDGVSYFIPTSLLDNKNTINVGGPKELHKNYSVTNH